MQAQKEGSGRDITACMRNLSNGTKGVSYQDFERVVREMGDITVSELKEVVTFATDQFGFWQTEWLFSPANSPNAVAATEIDGWKLLCRVFTEKLVKKVPEVKGLLDRQQSLTLLQHNIERRVSYNKTRPLERLFTLVLAKTSFALNKIGFASIAQKLYECSLYPKGTVGRANL